MKIKTKISFLILAFSLIFIFSAILSSQSFAEELSSVTIFAASDRHSNDENLESLLTTIKSEVQGSFTASFLIGDTFNGNNSEPGEGENGDAPPQNPDGDVVATPNPDETPPTKPTGEQEDENPEAMGPNPTPNGENPAEKDNSGEEETFNLTEVTETIQNTLGQTAYCYYTYGTHDGEETEEYFTGPIDLGYAYVYGITFSEMTNLDNATTSSQKFTDWINSVSTDNPVIIMSHVPLHQRRNDNVGAKIWFSAINKAGITHSILFLWAHNHTGETQTDIDVYLVKRGEKMTVAGNKNESTLQFTYANAGYILNGYGSVITAYDNGSLKLDKYNLTGLESSYVIESVSEREEIPYVPDTSDNSMLLWIVVTLCLAIFLKVKSKR